MAAGRMNKNSFPTIRVFRMNINQCSLLENTVNSENRLMSKKLCLMKDAIPGLFVQQIGGNQ